jgi:hypothetical protein
MTRGYFYLATPYSRYPHGLEAAFRGASRAAAKFVAAGVPVFSPIAHSHPIAKEGMLDLLDLSMWLEADAPFMAAAIGLIVVKMDGWEDSKGIAHEIEVFEKADKPVLFWDPTHPVPPGIIEWR